MVYELTELKEIFNEKTLLAVAVKRMNDALIGTKVLPERRVNDVVFEWRVYQFGDRSVASPVGEWGEPEINSLFNYEIRTAKADIYAEADVFTRFTQRMLSFDLVREKTEALVDKIALAEEKAIVDTLTDTTTYPDIATYTIPAGQEWDNSSATENPLDHIAALAESMDYANPDTLIVNKHTWYALKRHPVLREILKYTETGVNAIIRGQVLKLHDLNIMVLPAKIGNTPILNDKAILVESGRDLGMVAVADPIRVKVIPDELRETITIKVSKAFKPVLFRPWRVGIIENVTA